ncbi:GumC family protein [Tenacibaculum maritimum]|uniref:GumC family protein n=1 Tax=Tenacibaculum maritimum TaxID=107401 RepID=UPI0012E43756|nr:polysaccharide biosynthesis tyrosine autokinase [Tenacibaculum maritimum]MCD9581495.1 polysaccharide biosynthesis tyrosine autokinase [Tenacibaculum maritimum]MCD9635923.1 polysaccharide biosynthesis tyrosine autokinase [Tenacibaculum maritimum]CAA0171618.1 Capsular exopolysaccharide family [Tenacibaculum maritimum]
MSKELYTPKIEDNDIINIRAELEKYIIHWKWFLLGLILSLLGAFFYLKYATPKYLASTTILIKNDKKGGVSEELAAFGDLGIIGNSNKNVDNEIEILKSRTIISDVVRKLNLNIRYLAEGSIKDSEIYNKKPFSINFDSNSTPTKLMEIDTTLNIKIVSNDRFNLSNSKKDINNHILFNEMVTSPFLGNYKVEKNKHFNSNAIGKSFKIKITSLNKTIDSYLKRISIAPVNKKSSVLKISLQSVIKEKAENVLNELVSQYNEDAIRDKTQVSEKTSTFIVERLHNVSKELARIDDNVRNFKTTNNITDIQSEAQIALKTNTLNRQKLIEANTQLSLVKSLNRELNTASNELLPSNLGLEDANIGKSIAEYNNLILQKNRLFKSAGKKNTVIIELQDNIENIKNALKRSLLNREKSLEINLNNIRKEAGHFHSKISSIPTKERQFLDIARQQEIIAGLYSYLLKKKEETAISLAVTVPNAKIIDRAYGSDIPVSPKNKIIYLVFLFTGLLIPFIIIYVKDLLDTKVHTKKDIEEYTSIPFLGDIPHSDTKEKIIINEDARSSSAEAFRLIRTNLDFMLSDAVDGKGKTIFITSTTSGEGKSFISINLAGTLALSGKKVLLVGMDLRAPKVTEYLGLPDRKGVTNFITNENISLESLKFTIDELTGLDIISSGTIPPNPAELLIKNNRIQELFEEVRDDYDYIFIDTAPVGLVTDTLLIAKYADAFLYVTRSNYLDKRMLTIPQTLYKEKKLPNMAVVLNDTDMNKGYGYGYGYVTKDKKPWYKVFG